MCAVCGLRTEPRKGRQRDRAWGPRVQSGLSAPRDPAIRPLNLSNVWDQGFTTDVVL